MSSLVSILVSSSLSLFSTSAESAEPADSDGAGGSGSASGEVSLGGAKGKKNKGKKGAKADAGTKTRWIHRWPPQRNLIELGVMGGVYIPGANHELFEPSASAPQQGFRPLATIAPEIGLRFSYLPWRVFGFELEGAVMPTSIDGGASATLWTVRGGVIAQIPKWSVTPFLVAGGGALAVSSGADALGSDIDPSVYLGGGVKLYLSRRTQLRLDLRDVISHKLGPDETFKGHNFEALLSFALVLGRKAPKTPAPLDSDGDGFLDPDDSCVNEAGVAPDGCPVKDSDGDGFLDSEDSCVDEAGVAPDGCPVRDSDGDGFMDPDDACVDEAGVDPDGCPIRDADGDGILDDDDSCIDEPETNNGFEDADGCPDEVPEEVKRFTGVIKGIKFDTNKAKIRKISQRTLDAAVKVLVKYPDIVVEVSGHTDNRGKRDHNVELSQQRADAVRDYLVKKGVAEGQVRTRGAGPDEPIESNDTKSGRAKNRRIEFSIVSK